MKKPLSTVALVAQIVAFIVVGQHGADAQSGAAEILGTVTDMSGAPVAGTLVTVSNVDTHAERQLRADDRGRFAAPGLQPGRYEVTAEAPGFAPRRQEGLTLHPGERFSFKLELRRAPDPETLTIALVPHELETPRTGTHQVIESGQIEQMPTRNRDNLSLAALVPAVSSGTSGDDPSVMAHDSVLNRYVVDGFDRTNGVTNRPRLMASQAAANEFDVMTNGYPAESGRAGTGIFNVATKPGTNRVHGSAFEFLGDRRLNALKTIDRPQGVRPPYHSNQFGFVIGGPVVRSRDFFLLSYEGLRQTNAGGASIDFSPFVRSDPATLSALGRLAALASRRERPERRDVPLAKIDHQFGGGGRLGFEYSEHRSTGTPAQLSDAAPVVPTTATSNVRARSTGVSLGSTARGLVNEARVQYVTDRDIEPSPAEPVLIVSNDGGLVLRTGGTLLGPHDIMAKRLQVADSLSLVSGAHLVKTGMDLLFDQNSIRFNGTSSGAYAFESLRSFEDGIPSGPRERYTQTFIGPASTATSHPDVQAYSAFLQDVWRTSTTLTVDVGVRYDLQVFAKRGAPLDGQLAAGGLGVTVPDDLNNWGPRAGVAWRRGENSVVRGSYGLFYGLTPAMVPGLALTTNGPSTTLTVRGARVAPVYPNTAAALPGGLRSTAVVDQRFENPLVQQANVAWDWEKYRAATVGVSYLLARGTRLARAAEINAGRRFNGFDRVVAFESTGESLFNGATFRTRLRRTSLVYTASYTFARIDETPSGMPSLQLGTAADRLITPATTEAHRTPGTHDQHHHAAMSLVYDTTFRADRYHGFMKTLLRRWSFSFMYDAQSGHPYSAYAGADINADGNAFNDLAPGTTRNQFRLPWQMSFNPRVARDLHFGEVTKLSLIWEAFNLTNRPNYTAVDNTLYSVAGAGLERNPLFGRKTGQADGRMMQIAAKITF